MRFGVDNFVLEQENMNRKTEHERQLNDLYWFEFDLITQPHKKKSGPLTKHMYFYVFWVAESESEVKIKPFSIDFQYNLKKSFF